MTNRPRAGHCDGNATTVVVNNARRIRHAYAHAFLFINVSKIGNIFLIRFEKYKVIVRWDYGSRFGLKGFLFANS